MNNPNFNDTLSVFDPNYVDLDEVPSFQQPKPVAVDTKPAKRRYIISATVVDKFTIPRKRELLVPSRCIVNGCQFDIAKKNNTTWDDVPEHVKPRMLEALQKHVETAHNQSEDYIIDEDQLPTRWLGPERGLKDI